VGLIFAEASKNITEEGASGEALVYQALLKEAQKAGADAIINVVIDRRFEGTTTVTTPSIFGKTKLIGTETWYGSALAIKYGATLKTPSTVVTIDKDGNKVIVTEEGTVVNESNTAGSGGGGGGVGGGSSTGKKWYNPFTWFKK
jgi:hypothetical protein